MKSCNCQKCVSACEFDAGRLLPGDINQIIGFLKIDMKNLFSNYLIFKKYIFNNNEILIPAPVKLKKGRILANPGEIVNKYYENNPGRCIFLENSLCSIHSCKPFECKSYMGCADTFLGRPYDEKTVEKYFIDKWSGNAQKIINQFYID